MALCNSPSQLGNLRLIAREPVGQQLETDEQIQQLLLFARPIGAHALIGAFVGQQPSLAPRLDIPAQPETGQRRQIVRRRRYQRVARIFVRRAESAIAVLFEIQQAIAQDSEPMQHLARLIRHRAQVLADDDHPVAHALERENRKQRLEAIAHVGAFGGFHAIGNPVQAKEAHDMIDAQRSAMPAVLADGFGKQAVAVFHVAVRVGRRKAPVLALGREAVGRRAHPAAGHEEVAMRPKVGTETIGGQRQIVIQTDAQAALDSVLLRGGELQIELPLDVLVEQNTAPVFSREFARGRRNPGPGIAPASPSSSRRRGTSCESLWSSAECTAKRCSRSPSRSIYRFSSAARGVPSRHSSRNA